MKAFYYYLDSDSRKSVLRGSLNCPGANYMLFGADKLPAHDIEVGHNLMDDRPPTRWISRFAWLADTLVRKAGGSSGDFGTVFKSWRRSRLYDVIVSTVDNVGVPLAFLNYLHLIKCPLIYVSIGLPERIASIRKPALRSFYRRLYRHVPVFVSYGWTEAIKIREWLGLPSDSQRVVFIPFGVDVQALRPIPGTPEVVDVLSIGADMQRDFPLLMEVATRLPGLSFQLITSPRHAAMFKHIPGNVTMLTDVPFPAIRDHLAAARIIALPCHDNSYSGGTTTLLQAMAMAKPVVVTRTGAIQSGYHLESGKNCILVAPGAMDEFILGIQSLIDNLHQRKTMGMAARDTVTRHLSWDQYTRRFADLIMQQYQNRNSKKKQL